MNTLKSFTRHFTIGLVLISLLVISARFQSNIERADAFPLEEIGPKMELLEETMEFGKFAESFFSSNIISAATYSFTAGTAVLEDMSSGTTQLVGPGVDDTASPVSNIGFDFWYDGVRHSQFSVNPNGLARLGSLSVSGAFNNATGFATTTNAPKIAPYFEDLCVGSNGKVHFKTVGSAPNRKLVV